MRKNAILMSMIVLSSQIRCKVKAFSINSSIKPRKLLHFAAFFFTSLTF